MTGFPGVPTIFALLAELKSLADYDLSSIRYVTNTAAALPVKHIAMLQDLFPARAHLLDVRPDRVQALHLPAAGGSRRASRAASASPSRTPRSGSSTRTTGACGPGVVGQLVIRGATVMKGYWEKPEATAKKLKPGPLPGEQVLYTGDYCRIDEEGYLYFVGRMDEIIKSRGEKVAPKEVENALMDIPGVKEAAVIGVPDDPRASGQGVRRARGRQRRSARSSFRRSARGGSRASWCRRAS